MNYTYRLNGIIVRPEGDWEISYEKNEGQIFFRRHLRGELTFRGDDYQTIMGMSDCDILEFIVYCGTEEFWTGQFKFPYDFEIDADSCFMKGEPEVVDEYSCIMDNYETEYFISVAAGVGCIAPVINDCAGGNLHILPSACLLFATTASGNASYMDVLINHATRMNCGLTLSSSFIGRSNFPNGDNYAAAYGTNNYITGAANRLEYIFLLTNTFLRSSLGGTFCDGTAYFTFKEFEDLLRNWFNAYWYIDENGDFRIEHIRFFDPDFAHSDFTLGINLKNIVSNNGKNYAFRRNKYSYETGELYDQEEWSMQHYEGTEGTVVHGSDFDGVPVYYGAGVNKKSDCVPGKFREKILATPKFWSDITWAWAIATNPPNAAGVGQPDTIKCPGFIVLDVDTAAANFIRCEVGIYSGANAMNNHLSIANLQNHYHQYARMFLTGTMGGGGATVVNIFQSEIRKKLQEAIEFPLCCDEEFDAMKYVRTEMGDGMVKAATYKKRSIEIELLY